MKNKILILFLIALMGQLAPLPASAVKAYPFPVTVAQPDGTTLTIVLHGDEFHHFRTSEDGYVLKENAGGYFTYATMNAAGEIVETNIQARDMRKRTTQENQFLKTLDKAAVIQKARNLQPSPLKTKALLTPGVQQKVFPSVGSPKSLVILVNFSDTTFVTPAPQTAFTNLLNQQGYSTNGGTGSARDYFMASTYGRFSPTFVVMGPVTLPHPMAYYGKNDISGNDTLAVQMVVDACTAANNAGVDFTQYDTDNDGVIDNVFIYYAGHNEAEGGSRNSIWPHRWSVSPMSLYPSTYNYTGTVASVTFDGKRVFDYACTSELHGNSGSNMCGVGTFCHEFGHVLGLPDYYDTNGTKPTLGSWNIMDYGNYNNVGRTPPTYSAYDRFFLGFLTPQQASSTTSLTINPIYQGTTPPANTLNQSFLLSATTHNLNGGNPSPKEFFMLEYRQKTGWDTYLPAEGMCIWHIDYNQSVWNNNTPNVYTGTTQTLASHMRVYLIPPTGVGTTPATTAFTSGSFTPVLWSGTDINRALTGITTTTNNITFGFMQAKMTATGTFTSFSTTFGTPSASQSIVISGANLSGNMILNLQNNINFEMKLSTDVSWSKSLSLVPASGAVNQTIQVRYNPTMTGTQTDQLNISDSGLPTTNFTLNGTATIGPGSPVIYVGKIDNTLSFSPTKLNLVNTKMVDIQTTDLTGNLSLVVSGADAAMFTIPTSIVTRDAANGTGGYIVPISYTPTTVGNHTATLTISGGGLTPVKIISLTGTGL